MLKSIDISRGVESKYLETDAALSNIRVWNIDSEHKIFGSKLRVQIRLDDFRFYI